MSAKIICIHAINQSGCRNLKCNNLNVGDAEIIKIVEVTTTMVAVLTAILPIHVQH